jgi:2-methylcitrate dehydratase PrpD
MIAQTIAEYVSSARLADLPDVVRHEGERAFLNWLGCVLGGCQHPIVDLVDGALGASSGPKDATVIGRGHQYDVFLASYLNCISSSVHTFDDTHAEAMVHPTGPVASALFSIGELKGTLGSEILLALCLGVEMECRLSKAVSVAPARSNLAWSQTGITGGFGVAVAVGKLLGLSVKQLTWALGIAVSEAAGFRAMHGTMNLHLMHGRTSPSGIRAAMLAQKGLTSSEDSIESKFGFAALFSEVSNLDALTRGLGRHFELSANTYKPYPCGIVIHPIIDACMSIHEEFVAHSRNKISSVVVRAYPEAIALTSRKHPKDELDAQVSLYHWAATALMRGVAGIEETKAEVLHDPSICDLQDRIKVISDAAFKIDQAEVIVTLENGSTLTQRVDHCIGSAEFPMTDDQLEQKFRNQANMLVSSEVDKLLDRCWRICELPNVSCIAAMFKG